MIKLDILEKQAKTAYLSLGSNLGNKIQNIEFAKFKLEKNNIKIIKTSNKYETLSWPNKKKPKFINIVLMIKTTLPPLKLLLKCIEIEKELGRQRIKKNEPRTCDIDIIDYSAQIINHFNGENLVLPHPRMHDRNFVLLPLFEISSNWIHPLKKMSIKELIKSTKIEDLRTIKLI